MVGWVRPTAKPKESDGVECLIGEFDSLDDAMGGQTRTPQIRMGHSAHPRPLQKRSIYPSTSDSRTLGKTGSLGPSPVRLQN